MPVTSNDADLSGSTV